MREALISEDEPVLIDKFLEGALEVDVDAVADGETVHGRRGHGAHRGGRHPLRRLDLRDPAVHARRPHRCARCAASPPCWRARSACAGLHERAVRGAARRGLRARGQPARLAHGAVREQGRRASRWRGSRRASWPASGWPTSARAEPEVAMVSVKKPVLPFSRFPGEDALLGPGDEVHRRGHGPRPRLRPRAGQGAPGLGRAAADRRARCS